MMKPLDQKKTDSERVKVVVRVRPLDSKESENQEETVVEVDSDRNELSVRKIASNNSSFGTSSSETELKPFTFDGVFDNSFQQKQIYDKVFHSLVDSVLQGFNGTIFAYGQTGTGKTFTMEGSWESEDLHGVMPNSFKHIFEHISENPSKRYLIRASYLEIYQEDVRDLLSNGKLKKCEIREGANGVYIKDLSTYLCSNFKEISELMTKGNKNRAVGSTNMNEHSSRSHAIFQITVETSEQWDEDGEHIKVGKLNLVDLAGSERASKTGAEGERFKEATKINLSLSTLGNVISALVDDAAYIPYRDSKLTRLLQDSLGGNSRTVMVATVGPAAFNYDETMNTLRYASRAKNIKNKPRINENPKDAVLRHYQEEINRLRNLVDEKKAQRQLPGSENESDNKMTGELRQRTKSGTLASEISKGQNPIDLMKESRVQQLTKLLEPYGIKFEGDLCEIMHQLQDRKVSLMKNTQMVKEDKEKLLMKLQHATDEIRSVENECSHLVVQIEWLESKVLNSSGKQNLIQKMKHQKKEIEMKEKELEDQRRRQEQLRKTLVEKQMTFEETLSTLNATEEEFSSKIEKISKIERKAKGLGKEKHKAKNQHGDNIKRVEKCIDEISRELKLKKAIVDNFIPRKVLKDIDKRIRYDDVEDAYFIEPLVPTSIEPIPVDRMILYPLFNKTRFKTLSPTDNTFFSNENLLLLEPELPKWKSKHYVADKINPKMEILIKEAMKDMQKTLVVNCDHRTNSSTWKREAPAYTAVGPNILLRKIRSEKFVDFSYVPSDINLPRGCNISTIHIPPRSNNMRKFTHEELLALPFITISGEIIFEDQNPHEVGFRPVANSTMTNNSVQQFSPMNLNETNYDQSNTIPHTTSPAIPSRRTTACRRSSKKQYATEWIPKTKMDYEIEQMERELDMNDLEYNLYENSASNASRIQLTSQEELFADDRIARPRTSRPESRKGNAVNPTGCNRPENFEDSHEKVEKRSMENEIIRRLKRVGLHSPIEHGKDGQQSLGDYMSMDAVKSSHLQFVVGNSDPNIPKPRLSEERPVGRGSELFQAPRPPTPVKGKKSHFDRSQPVNYKEQEYNQPRRVVPGPSCPQRQVIDPIHCEEDTPRPKTARKMKTSSEVLSLLPPERLATLPFISEKQMSILTRDFEEAIDEVCPGAVVETIVHFPTFRTANDIGKAIGTEDDYDAGGDEESWHAPGPDQLAEPENDFSDSDLSQSSEEDNSIDDNQYRSTDTRGNSNWNDEGSDADNGPSQRWQTDYSEIERPPTRPSSQRRVNH